MVMFHSCVKLPEGTISNEHVEHLPEAATGHSLLCPRSAGFDVIGPTETVNVEDEDVASWRGQPVDEMPQLRSCYRKTPVIHIEG